ncbi:MAG: EMC3/TMCO1 family protein [Promethearchaeota archaeon]
MSGIVIFQIFLVTLGMVIISMIFNKVTGLNRESAREIREQTMDLQERMRVAQQEGNGQNLGELQRESIELTKTMMKKQLIPSCLRCFIFCGIFGILGILFAQYTTGLLPFPVLFFGDGWIGVYFLFSISLSLLFYLVKRIYRKMTGKEDIRKMEKQEIMGMLNPTSASSNSRSYMQLNVEPSEEIHTDDPSKRKDSWKEKIKN